MDRMENNIFSQKGGGSLKKIKLNPELIKEDTKRTTD